MWRTMNLRSFSLLANLAPMAVGWAAALLALRAGTSRFDAAVLLGAGVGAALSVVSALVFSSFIAGAIARSACSVSSTADEIAATVDQRERLAVQQAAAANETTAAMEELAASARQSAEQAENLAVGSRHGVALADEGALTVEQTLEGMTSLKGKVHAIAEKILQLSEQASQIGTITNLVTDVASQTNMLALNAAVEAARAGEQGRGFSVVAVEIRKLADQTKRSAEKINTLVTDIMKAVNSTVMATEEGTKTVDEGVQTANKTYQSFVSVRDAISKASENTQQISLNAKQQSLAVNEVLRAMSELSGDAKTTAASLRLGRSRAEKLMAAASGLQAIIQRA